MIKWVGVGRAKQKVLINWDLRGKFDKNETKNDA
jgi:hypothetical protein